MSNWNHERIKTGFSNGAEIDLNIHENFPEEELVKFIKSYAEKDSKIGANIITGETNKK